MTYKLIDYERLKAFSEGLKSKYAKKTDISNMKISQFVDVYKLDKSIFDAIKNDKNFIDAIKRDIFTLVVYDKNNASNLKRDDGCNSYVFYQGANIAVAPRFAPPPSFSNVIESAIFDSHCFINQTFMNAYNKVIQREIEAVQPSVVSFEDLDSLKEAGLFFCLNSNLDSHGLLLNRVNSSGFIYQFLFLIDHKKDFVVKARLFNGNTEKWKSWQIFWTSEMLDEKINTKIDKTAITDNFKEQIQDKVLSQKGAYDLWVTSDNKIQTKYMECIKSISGMESVLNNKPNKSDIPTKLSQLTNDKNYKTETEIQSMIEKASSLKKEVVTSLPTTGKDDVIYLVKDDKGKENNNYLEYLWLNGKYELIGSTQVDLSGYAKQGDIVASKIIDKYVLNKDFRTALNNDQDFLKAIKRDMFTLVNFDGSASDELVEQAGFESILYYKGSVCGICLVPSGSVVDETFVKQNKFSQGEAYITSSLMFDYNKVIQSQIGELQSSQNNYLDKNKDKADTTDIGTKEGSGKYVDASLLGSVTADLYHDLTQQIANSQDIQEFTQQELEEAFR